MSLESQIADLVSAANGLITVFSAKKSSIDAAVAAAIAAVPANKKIFYVHQLNGLDTNDGSITAPLKTIDKALANTPYGGICAILLQADYLMSANVANLEGRFLELRSDDPANRRFLRPIYYDVSGVTQLTAFPASGGNALHFRDLKIELPSATGLTVTVINNCLLRAGSTTSSALFPVKMTDTTVTDVAGATACIVSAGASAIVLECIGVTFPASFGGRYISGVASGAAPNTLANVMSNLSAL
ncbi:hypothetical protein [Pseudomonas sp. TMW 2.1634]|uniref:hypothetical protein n=1 Tax=Pseudomonas sp. TMW 2.1634 TaxID=1886807 RepID=UPI000E739692|nr:hypothetical protein [Pseudomonas sp. TMW 2.1634]AOA05691.1 hypothetical protein BFC21_07825 [Pseudomonas sp. TMW 2.1634]AOA08939.1 hypothetical protein BFC21_25390 [Pseudomonas sp. TMW 2.1634]